MKIPFKADAAAALAKACAKLADIEASIATLQISRTEKLATVENITEIQSIDHAIAAERAAAEIYRDKIRILKEEVRKQRYVEREKDRTAAIAAIEKVLAGRERTAIALEETIVRLGNLYHELIGAESVAPLWPFSPPSPGFGIIDRDKVRQECGWALFSAGRPVRGESTLPAPNNVGLGVTGVLPLGIAGAVARQSRSVLDALEIAAIDHDDEQGVAA